jgi:acetyl esterase/lipase
VANEDILSRMPPAADQRVEYGPDPSQFVDVRLPAGKEPHPVVFFIHGGYWRAKYDLSYAGHLCHALKDEGIATWNVEYRRVGNPGGGWPGTFEDIRAAFQALMAAMEKGGHPLLDRKRLCVAGHSAGAQLALCLAANSPQVTRVLSLAGVLDLRRGWELHLSNDAVAEFLGGSPNQVPELYREASPAEQRIPRPVQKLIHGALDDDVPYELSEGYAARKSKAGERVELITLRQTGHYEMVDPGSTVWSRVLRTFALLTRA